MRVYKVLIKFSTAFLLLAFLLLIIKPEEELSILSSTVCSVLVALAAIVVKIQEKFVRKCNKKHLSFNTKYRIEVYREAKILLEFDRYKYICTAIRGALIVRGIHMHIKSTSTYFPEIIWDEEVERSKENYMKFLDDTINELKKRRYKCLEN